MDPAKELQPEVRAVLEAAVSGETGGLGDLLESYRPRLERLIAFRMDRRLAGRVEPGDVLQEAFAEVLARLPRYLAAPDADFFPWVRYLTHQKLLQHHRHHLEAGNRDARLEVPLTLGGLPGASSIVLASAILDRQASPSVAAVRAEEAQRLQAALEEMKEIDREILMLRHFEQVSNREAAQILGLTEAGASQRYLRALKRLRETLDSVQVPSDGFGRE